MPVILSLSKDRGIDGRNCKTPPSYAIVMA